MTSTNYFAKQFMEKNPGKPVPPNMGKPWTEFETQQLLKHVENNNNIQTISNIHGRTEGGIESRLLQLAYDMHLNGMSYSEIFKKTKVNQTQLDKKIYKMQFESKPKSKEKKIKLESNCNDNNNIPQFNSYNELLLVEKQQNDYLQMQADIKEIKNDIKKIYELLKGLELA